MYMHIYIYMYHNMYIYIYICDLYIHVCMYIYIYISMYTYSCKGFPPAGLSEGVPSWRCFSLRGLRLERLFCFGVRVRYPAAELDTAVTTVAATAVVTTTITGTIITTTTTTITIIAMTTTAIIYYHYPASAGVPERAGGLPVQQPGVDAVQRPGARRGYRTMLGIALLLLWLFTL